MRKLATMLAIALGGSLLAGCETSEDPSLEGVTLGAGNAVAYNSALQIIDPWPVGVQDTDIVVPADRGSDATGGDTSATGGSSTTGSTPVVN